MLCSPTSTTTLIGILCSATLVECRLFTSPSGGDRDCRAGGFGSRFALPLQLSRFSPTWLWLSGHQDLGMRMALRLSKKGIAQGPKLWIYGFIWLSMCWVRCYSAPATTPCNASPLRLGKKLTRPTSGKSS